MYSYSLRICRILLSITWRADANPKTNTLDRHGTHHNNHPTSAPPFVHIVYPRGREKTNGSGGRRPGLLLASSHHQPWRKGANLWNRCRLLAPAQIHQHPNTKYAHVCTRTPSYKIDRPQSTRDSRSGACTRAQTTEKTNGTYC